MMHGSQDGVTTTTGYDQTVSHALLNMLTAFQDAGNGTNVRSPFNPNETLFILEESA